MTVKARRRLQIRFTEARYYCPKCGRTVNHGYPGSQCYHGGTGPPTRMKAATDQEESRGR